MPLRNSDDGEMNSGWNVALLPADYFSICLMSCNIFFFPCFASVMVILTVTVESSDLISVRSELHKKVVMEDRDAQFSCEVDYFLPGMMRMVETDKIGINVLCKFPDYYSI